MNKNEKLMRSSFMLIATIIIFSLTGFGQTIKLTDNLLFPRLDSTYWEKDYDALNRSYSKIANRCQTCVFKQTDSTRGRFCFNTSLGQAQLDTALHNFAPEKLVGQWIVINYGLFEITDSILPDSKVYYRNLKTLNEQKDAKGYVSFTDKRFKTDFKNIKEVPNKNKRYKILDGKILTTKTLSGYCGATIIGLTKDGYLILDDHTYRTLAKKGKYLLIMTSIRRIILKKNTTA